MRRVLIAIALAFGTLCARADAAAAVVQASYYASSNASGANSIPTGFAATPTVGDLYALWIGAQGGSGPITITPPAGWTAYAPMTLAGITSQMSGNLFYRTIDSSDTVRYTTIPGALAATGATSITVATGTGSKFTGGTSIAVIDPGTTSMEEVTVSSVATDTLTVASAVCTGTCKTHLAGAVIMNGYIFAESAFATGYAISLEFSGQNTTTPFAGACISRLTAPGTTTYTGCTYNSTNAGEKAVSVIADSASYNYSCTAANGWTQSVVKSLGGMASGACTNTIVSPSPGTAFTPVWTTSSTTRTPTFGTFALNPFVIPVGMACVVGDGAYHAGAIGGGASVGNAIGTGPAASTIGTGTSSLAAGNGECPTVAFLGLEFDHA